MLLDAPGAAAQSATAQAMLEEVVVTARRREENLQDLPLSIAAITGDQMQTQGIYSIEDAGDFVPNVTLTQSERANNTRVVIRGIGGGGPDPVEVFGSGMYIDGHYIPNSQGGFLSTLDIERVEVLRGPQGTLFGKNVTGGAVNIISAKPGPDFDSSLTLRAAEHGQQDLRGMINFPISDTVFARISLATEQLDGYYYNRNLDIDTNGKDMSAITGAIRFTPGNWTIDASANLHERRDDNVGVQCNDFDGSSPQWGGGTGHLERLYPGATQDFKDACNADAALGAFVNSSDKVTWSNIDEESIFATAQWDSDGAVGGLESLTVKMNASHRDVDYTYFQDRDGSFFAVDAIGSKGPGANNRTRGAEFLVEADVNDRLSFTTGINYFEETHFDGTNTCHTNFAASGAADDPGSTIVATCPIEGLHFELLPFPRDDVGGPGPFMSNKSVWNESIGVFGHLTYSLSDNWDLDVGARWTEDDREFNNIEWASVDCDIGTHPADRVLGVDTGITGHCEGFTAPMTFDTVINNGFFNTASDTFSEVTPMVSLTRHLAGGDVIDSGMVYFLYSEGFLTGGFNTEINSNLPDTGPLLAYDPEHVKNYEVGFKGTLADGRVRIMADVFFMDYTNRQDTIDIPNPDGDFGIDDPLGVVQNVSSVDISGIEVELRTIPWDGGFLTVDIGVLDNEYGDYSYPNPSADNDPAACSGTPVGDRCDLTDTVINDLSADWTLNIGLEHEFQLGNGATLTPRLNVYASDGIEYQDGRFNSDGPGPCYQDSYTRVGARLTYAPAAGNWQASLFGNNVTDELIYENCSDSRGVYVYRHERPAYWGLEFQARWGASAN
jgi:iron complex outermembrane receptor protein